MPFPSSSMPFMQSSVVDDTQVPPGEHTSPGAQSDTPAQDFLQPLLSQLYGAHAGVGYGVQVPDPSQVE
jgi:hypothetical protein